MPAAIKSRPRGPTLSSYSPERAGHPMTAAGIQFKLRQSQKLEALGQEDSGAPAPAHLPESNKVTG